MFLASSTATPTPSGPGRASTSGNETGGATYQEIAAKGGGILSTVRAVQNATDAGVSTKPPAVACNRCRAGDHHRRGQERLRTVDAARTADARDRARETDGRADDRAHCLLGTRSIPTFPRTVRRIHDPRNAVRRRARVLGHHGRRVLRTGRVDARRNQCLFEAAKRPAALQRVHADQFTSMGMVERAISLGRDLGRPPSKPRPMRTCADSRRAAPSASHSCCGFHLDGRYAARADCA